MNWYLITGGIGFVAGIIFHAKVLDKPEISGDMSRRKLIKAWKCLKIIIN